MNRQNGSNLKPCVQQHGKVATDDMLTITLLPKTIEDVVQLEKEIPEMFVSDESGNISETARIRTESEKSNASRSSHQTPYVHRRILPIFVFGIKRSQLCENIRNGVKPNRDKSGAETIRLVDCCWKQELREEGIGLFHRQESCPSTRLHFIKNGDEAEKEHCPKKQGLFAETFVTNLRPF